MFCYSIVVVMFVSGAHFIVFGSCWSVAPISPKPVLLFLHGVTSIISSCGRTRRAGGAASAPQRAIP